MNVQKVRDRVGAFITVIIIAAKMTTKKLQVKHLPSDYPLSDEALMDVQADQEAKHGEERISTND